MSHTDTVILYPQRRARTIPISIKADDGYRNQTYMQSSRLLRMQAILATVEPTKDVSVVTPTITAHADVTVKEQRSLINGHTVLVLSNNAEVHLHTDANVAFYKRCLERRHTCRFFSGKDTADATLDKQAVSASTSLEEPGRSCVHYLGRLTAPVVTTDALSDGVPWPPSVIVQQDTCDGQGMSLCGWQALGNAFEDIANAWPVDTNESDCMDLVMANEALDIRSGRIPDIEEDFMQWLLQRRGDFRGQRGTRTIRDVAMDPEGPIRWTDSQMERLGSSCGVTVLATDDAHFIAFSRLTSRFSDTAFASVVSFREEHSTSAAGLEELITDLTLTEGVTYVRNVFAMWPVLYAKCCDDNDCYSFMQTRTNPTIDYVPPGVLIYDAELLHYPDMRCLRGRRACFVVNTLLPALSMAMDTAGNVASIDIRVEPTGGLQVLDHPAWMGYGHWISATLDIGDDSCWVWTVKDSLNPEVKEDQGAGTYAHIIRELTMFVLGAFRARSAWVKMRHRLP